MQTQTFRGYAEPLTFDQYKAEVLAQTKYKWVYSDQTMRNLFENGNHPANIAKDCDEDYEDGGDNL